MHNQNKGFWSGLIRIGFEIYIELLFCSSFNIYNISFKNSYDTTSSVVASIWFTLIVIFTVTIVTIIIFANKEVDDEYIKKSKIKVIYENLKKSKSSMTSHLVFIIWRVLLVIIVLSLHNKGVLQIALFTIVIISMLAFKIIFKPLRTKLMNVQDIIGDFLIFSLWISYFNLMDESTEFATSGKGHIIGLIWLAIIATMILYFYIFLIIASIFSCLRKKKNNNAKISQKKHPTSRYNYIHFFQTL